MAETESYITPDKLDTDPQLLTFENGTVDLSTGIRRSHRREDYITKMVHHNYLPEAKCPRWILFLHECMRDTSERMVPYLQRSLGYSITGEVSEKAVFIAIGLPDAGKSTLLNILRAIFKEHSVLIQIETLMLSRHPSPNAESDKADLRGARFAQTSEAEEGQRLACSKLKQITQGVGSQIKAIRKYENSITFPETHKLWIDTNYKPIINNANDAAVFKRLHPITFAYTVPKEKQDPKLSATLLKESAGIIAWVVEGAKEWYARGLQKPTEVEAARNAWREESDHIARFIEERCDTSPEGVIKAADLYAAFQVWAKAAGVVPYVTETAFGTKITDMRTEPESENRRFQKKHSNSGALYYGLKLQQISYPPRDEDEPH